MKKCTNALLAITVILGLIAATTVLLEIFSTSLNKYYKVDGK